MIGQTISHYKITAKLGEGGMGEVFLATDTSLDRKVALKFLPSSLQSDPEARERLIREAKAASRLRHTNILTIYSVEQHEGRDFIVMEYVEGKPLTGSSREAHRSIPETLELAIAVADGLQKAHAAGIIHRDLKPANILVDSDGIPRIVDFGLAKVQGAAKLTKSGATVGTVAYMSPEQALGKDTDERSDIFSFGAVLYELVTGRTPFPGEHEAAITYSIINEAAEPLSRFKSGVPAELERIVAKALAKSPSERYQSVADLAADLRHLRSGMSGAFGSAIRPPSILSKSKRRWPYVVAAVLSVLVAALLIFRPFKLNVSPDQEAVATAANSLAVMYFDNLADPSDQDRTAQMLTSLLITGLSESQYLQVISRQRLYDILARMGKGDAKSIDRTTATEVAKKARVHWMVTGMILQVQPRVVLTAEVSEVGSGQLVTTQKITGQPGEDVFAVADRISQAIRGNLSLSDQAKAEKLPVMTAITTRSQEAYRYYTEGADYVLRHQDAKARESFEKALTYDSTFAMVYYQMSRLNLDIEPVTLRREWSKRSEQYAENATWKEQRYIRAGTHWYRREYDSALTEIEQILARYPNEVEAIYEEAGYYNNLNRTQDAIASYEKLVAIDPQFAAAYNGLAYSYHQVGNLDKSMSAINQYIELMPNEADPYDSRGDLYAYGGSFKEAIASYQKALQIDPAFGIDEKLGCMYLYEGNYARAESTFQAMSQSPDPDTRVKGRSYLYTVTAYQGQFTKSLKIVNEALAADRREGYDGVWHLRNLGCKSDLFEAMGDLDQAVVTAADVRKKTREMLGNSPGGDYDLVRLLAKKGDTLRAREVFENLKRDVLALKSKSVYQTSYLDFAAAYIALLLENNLPKACSTYERTIGFLPSLTSAYDFCGVYLRRGMPEKGVQTLERSDLQYPILHARTPFYGVCCHYLLGHAYEQSGLKDKAVEQYKVFLDIWKDADPGIKEIDDAKARLAKLQSSS